MEVTGFGPMNIIWDQENSRIQWYRINRGLKAWGDKAHASGITRVLV